MEDLHIVVICGTARQNNMSIHAARLITQLGNEIDGVTTQLIDPATMKIPYEDGNDEHNKMSEWVEINKKADAYFIVAPEYNHGYPGTLKKLLDNDLGNYTHKPVALAGVSAGKWGGTRVIESLLPVLRTIGMVATFRDVQFPNVNDLFDENGDLQDDSYVGHIQKAYEELVWMGRKLKG